jgi:hypothetical protein
VDFCRSLGSTTSQAAVSTHGAVRIDWRIVNPMAWAARTVDNQLKFGRLFDQQICHCGTP